MTEGTLTVRFTDDEWAARIVGFWRAELDRFVTSQAAGENGSGFLESNVPELLPEHLSSIIVAEKDAAGRTAYVCKVTIDVAGMCRDLARLADQRFGRVEHTPRVARRVEAA